MALERLRNAIKIAPSTMAMVEKTLASEVSIPVFTFSLNAVFHDWYRDIKDKRADFKKINRHARTTVENICLLSHCEELDISLSNFWPLLDKVDLLKKGQHVSKMSPEVLHITRSFIRVLSVWRVNGGSSTWRKDAPMVLEYVKQYQDNVDSLIDAIKASGSISGRLVGTLDNVPTPVLEGAL